MFKKILTFLLLLIVVNIPLAAQHTHVELTYQSFRPFIHFQLNFTNHDAYDYDSYESTYLNGYMDGVNNEYYFGPHFIAPQHVNVYRSGYRDGLRDRILLIRLRGHGWYKRHRFAHDDYYAPELAVRIWLEGISLAFLQAPAHQLPSRWQHRVHPRVKEYRKWMARHSHHKDYDHYYSSTNVERRFKTRIRGYRQKMTQAKKRNRQSISHDHDRDPGKRYRKDRAFNPYGDIKRDRKNARINRGINANDAHEKRTVKRDRRKKQKKAKVRKRSRGSNKSKQRSRGRDRNN